MLNNNFTTQTKALIDNLKGICSEYGLGNDGDEFKIIIQVVNNGIKFIQVLVKTN